MSPLHNQHFTVFGGAYVTERHGSFRLPESSEQGSLAPWGAVLCTLLVAAATFALKTTAAAMNNLTLLN
jgi:hypothetical protein